MSMVIDILAHVNHFCLLVIMSMRVLPRLAVSTTTSNLQREGLGFARTDREGFLDVAPSGLWLLLDGLRGVGSSMEGTQRHCPPVRANMHAYIR
eukprot:scaffold189187_cov18-Prasinocladus_malaysianus.AAC.1